MYVVNLFLNSMKLIYILFAEVYLKKKVNSHVQNVYNVHIEKEKKIISISKTIVYMYALKMFHFFSFFTSPCFFYR